MTNWKPLFYVLIIILVVGGVLSVVLNNIYNTDFSSPNPQSGFANGPMYSLPVNWIQSSFISFFSVDTGISIFGFKITLPISINPFALFGNDAQTFLVQQINIITYIPDIILIPFIIVVLLALLWFGVKLILP